ncbi:MAG: ATP-binding cassette domain-containing protein [Verrucomicrobia bacterium]|nr:ATP-binding cassette domain-containing protein [Verrucomicrobiota bacterium]
MQNREHDRTVLELSHVTKLFGAFQAVNDLCFRVPRGSIYGFLGPNGAGKTTTIRMILDIIKPSSGEITVLGKRSALEVRQRLGYLPEEKGLYKKMKAWAIISYFAMLKGMSRRDSRKRACELLERYGLGAFAETKAEALSKGMGQKVQMLAAVAHDPEFVILDEPFSGLDPVNQQVMETLIRDMADRGQTVIFSTHVMQHAERLCDRILLIAKGRKIFDGTLPEARRAIPRRVRIETEDDIGQLRELPEVLAIFPNDGLARGGVSAPPCSHWEFQLRENADPQIILQACFTKGIRLRSFNQAEPSLHEVFVHLVGSDAAPPSNTMPNQRVCNQ